MIVLAIATAIAVLYAGGIALAVWFLTPTRLTLPKPSGLQQPLTEADALQFAWTAISKAGLKAEDWTPVLDRHAAENYFLRDTINPDSGSIRFFRRQGGVIVVNVEVRENEVDCEVISLK